jgi:hypothetical protein
MTFADLVDRLTLVACALFVDLALAWIVFHPIVAVYAQLGMVAAALAWRFGVPQSDAVSVC